jgi:transposase
LPPGVEITGYERHGNGHGFEVTWPWPERWCCVRCHREEEARPEVTDKVRVVRDLDVWEQPSFWIYQAVFHRCSWCQHRQDILPPFKRKEVSYTYRFEKHVVRMLIGSNEEEVARRLGISAETVARIVKNQLVEDVQIDPGLRIEDVGIDEISLKKRHKLYATVLTDLTNPAEPRVLAVAKGKDEAAGRVCLEKLSPAQRQQIRSYRVDMGAPLNKACEELLPKAKGVADRFHVAKLFNEAIDAERKKNHEGVQGGSVGGGAQGISRVDVGVSPRSAETERRGATEVGDAVQTTAEAAETSCSAGAFQGDL